jgi:hypothetical protein
MPTYRAYRLDERRRIITAQWIEASNDESAVAEAREDLCEDEVPAVEIWHGTRLVDEVDCDED